MLEKNHVRATAIAVLMVLSAFSTQAQQQTTVIPRPDEPASGTISGRVVNENGQSLIGATVFVRAVGTSTPGRTTITDSEGNFQLSALDQSAYSVSAMLPAYATAPRDSDTPTYYRVGDSVRLELVRGGVITGTVTTAAGESVVAINVRAYRIRDAKGQPPKSPLTSFGERSTDDRGVYRIYGLAPGTYLVAAGGSGYSYGFWMNGYDSDSPTYAPSSTRDNAAEITVRIGEESSVDIRYRGEPGHTVSGTIKAQGTNGATITLVPAGNGFIPSGSNYQPRGTRGFAISGVGDGDYELVAQEVVSPQGVASYEMAFSEFCAFRGNRFRMVSKGTKMRWLVPFSPSLPIFGMTPITLKSMSFSRIVLPTAGCPGNIFFSSSHPTTATRRCCVLSSSLNQRPGSMGVLRMSLYSGATPNTCPLVDP